MKATQLAKKIDAMTFAEVAAMADQDDLPTPGGDYDTKSGWAKRLGYNANSTKFYKGWNQLEAAKKINAVRGRKSEGNGGGKITLYHSPTLARMCG